MTTTAIAARRLAGAVRAEIIGLDLARPTPELAEVLLLRRLLEDDVRFCPEQHPDDTAPRASASSGQLEYTR